MSGAPNLRLLPPPLVTVDGRTSTPAKAGEIGVGQGLPPEEVLRLSVELGFGHICQQNGHEFEKEVQAATALTQSPEKYFAYPAAAILTPDNITAKSERALMVLDQTFDSSIQKRIVIDRIVNAMESKGFPKTLCDDVTTVADELYTNAIYNAPFVNKTTFANPGISRHALEIRMEDGKSGRIFLAHDETRLLVGCVDPYGSLSVERYLTKVRTTYRKGAAAAMNFGPGGAGLGSYIIFNAGCSLFVGVRPGRSTVIGCIVPLGMSNRMRAEQPKHFHWIQP